MDLFAGCSAIQPLVFNDKWRGMGYGWLVPGLGRLVWKNLVAGRVARSVAAVFPQLLVGADNPLWERKQPDQLAIYDRDECAHPGLAVLAAQAEEVSHLFWRPA